MDEGIATRSRHRPDPLLHLLWGYGTWCSGAPSLRENTMTRSRCPRCTALLRDGVERGDFDQAELDRWLDSTQSR